ncbi:acetate kinase, partial [Patescibacteria group bacterium]|nr:acetate kinase [Patescibacteria group bacterium]
GISNDMRLIEKKKNAGNRMARLAMQVFIYRIKKYVGAYWAVLEGCKAIVLTGTVGAGRPETREAIMKGMSCLGKIRVLTVKTDEEKIIARQTRKKV